MFVNNFNKIFKKIASVFHKYLATHNTQQKSHTHNQAPLHLHTQTHTHALTHLRNIQPHNQAIETHTKAHTVSHTIT